ncbi:MAG: zinc ribbon domain-containing protein [Trichodesmium sp. St19_bin1]|nr:zinc ribbon domain-containing protein [Trichodesmium sp. St2_bin2_1]MDE5121713.1 zinc ribbon domain-containing protein [Trichodesmium sp. St19_bin1]
MIVHISFLSSKTCSNCGHVQDMPFNLRTYDCLDCCFSIDRDLQQLYILSLIKDLLQLWPCSGYAL